MARLHTARCTPQTPANSSLRQTASRCTLGAQHHRPFAASQDAVTPLATTDCSPCWKWAGAGGRFGSYPRRLPGVALCAKGSREIRSDHVTPGARLPERARDPDRRDPAARAVALGARGRIRREPCSDSATGILGAMPTALRCARIRGRSGSEPAAQRVEVATLSTRTASDSGTCFQTCRSA
jgi:hypothetical protein